MKKVLTLILFLASFAVAQAPPFMTVTASNIYGTGGTLLSSGTVVWQSVDSNGNPVGYQVNGGGQQITFPTVCSVVNGAITGGCQLPNASVTNPMNVCFAVTIKNSANQVVSPPSNGYSCVQPQTSNSWCSLGTCNLDKYAPSNPSVVTAQLSTPQSLSLGGVYSFACPPNQAINTVLNTGSFLCGAAGGGGGGTGLSWLGTYSAGT